MYSPASHRRQPDHTVVHDVASLLSQHFKLAVLQSLLLYALDAALAQSVCISVAGSFVLPLVISTRPAQHTWPAGDVAEYAQFARDPNLHSDSSDEYTNARLCSADGALTGMLLTWPVICPKPVVIVSSAHTCPLPVEKG